MRWWGIPIALSFVVGGGAYVWVQDGAHATVADRCAAISAAAQDRRAEVSGAGSRVVVIGDSYTQGAHLEDPHESWTRQLEGEVVTDGFAGSGFSAEASPCRDVAFQRRVDRALSVTPGLVVVQGGLNDTDVAPAKVASGARRVLHALEGHPTVVVGPVAAPRRAAGAVRVDVLLAEIAAGAGVPYIRTLDWDLDYLPDRLHLTVAGHAEFGRNVQVALAALAVPSG